MLFTKSYGLHSIVFFQELTKMDYVTDALIDFH